ncbi:MAG: hypothetical protein ACETWM_14480 [Candidatus Lokiarchaeia archaeon]
MSNSETIMGSYDAWVNVSWGNIIPVQMADKTVELRKIKYKKGIPAWILISESRLFLLSEFNAQTKFMYVLPLSRKKRHSLYMELALEKLHGYSFGTFNNYIEFEPHGQVGKTRIDFKSISIRQKQLLQGNLEKAKILNTKAPDVGIVISGRPVEEVFMERTGLTSLRETIQALRSLMQLEPWTPLTQTKPHKTVEYAKAGPSPKYDFCPNCGNVFSEKYTFCPICGARISY